MKNCVGLFGTCGDSKWRDPVMKELDAAGIEFFNPVVEDWNDEAAANEADHAANDKVIVQNITGETAGLASLAESGWLALLASSKGQSFVFVMEDMEATVENKHNNKARNLIRKYQKKIAELGVSAPNGVYFFNSMEEAMPAIMQLMVN